MRKLQAGENLYFRPYANTGFYEGTKTPPAFNETDVFVVEGLRTRNILPVKLNTIVTDLNRHIWSLGGSAQRSLRHEALIILLKHVTAEKKPDLGLSFKLINKLTLGHEGRLIDAVMRDLRTHVNHMRMRTPVTTTTSEKLFSLTEQAIREGHFDTTPAHPANAMLVGDATYVRILRTAYPNRGGLSSHETEVRRALLQRVTKAVNAAGYEAFWSNRLTRGALGVFTTTDHPPELFLTDESIKASGLKLTCISTPTLVRETPPRNNRGSRRVRHLTVVK